MIRPSRQLQELFPLHSKFQIEDALTDSSGALEAAAQVLLQQQPAAAAAPAVTPGQCNHRSPKVRLEKQGEFNFSKRFFFPDVRLMS